MPTFHEVSAYLQLPRNPAAWIIQDLLPTSGYVNMFGKPKSGKSFMALQLASAVATPATTEWMGFPVRTHGKVAYLQVDTPRGVWMERLEEVAPNLPLDNIYFVDIDEHDIPYPFNILGEGASWLMEAVKSIPDVELLVIDTIREIHDQEENSSSEMKRVIAGLRAAARGPAILLLSHSRKSQPNGFTGDVTDENRGTGYVAGRMDSILHLTERTLTAKGRALELHAIGVQFDPEKQLFFMADSFHAKSVELIQTRKGESLRELARSLKSAFPKKTEAACWSKIRRVERDLR